MIKIKNKFLKKCVTEIKRFASFWSKSKAGTFGSSVAYYAIFSFAPILIIAISIGTLFVGQDSATSGLVSEFTTVFGHNGAEFIKSLLMANISRNTSIITSIVGFVVLLLGAAGVFGELQNALDTIFESLPEKGKVGLWQTIKQKLLSYGMVLSLGFILLVSLGVSAIINFLTIKIGTILLHAEILATILDSIVTLLLISIFIAFLYKFLPTHRLRWKPALIGGLLTGILFTISKLLLGLYLSSSGQFDTYGAASALVIFIVWIYYMAQVFFFSAVIVRLYVVSNAAHKQKS